MSLQHQSLTVERKIIRADQRDWQPSDENRICAYWNSDEEIMRRVLEGDATFVDAQGRSVPMAPRVFSATPTKRFLEMGREDIISQQSLMCHNPTGAPLRADDLGFLLATGRKDWPRAFRRLKELGHPMAAVVATWKGRDLETTALTASTAPGMFLAWGTNPATLTAAVTDISLFAERTTAAGFEARTSVSPTQQTTSKVNDTWQYQGTITALGTVTIAEAGVFSSSTQPTQNTVAAAGVVGSNSSTTLNTGSTFSPGNNNYVQIRTEFMQVTAGSGTTALTVVRMNNVAANLGGGAGNISTIAVSDVVTPGNPPGQSGITGGSMLIHADHTGDGLNSGDSIQYTVKDQLT
jgi:hypothetical protein